MQTVRPVPVRLGEMPVEIAVPGLTSPLTGETLPSVRLADGDAAPLIPVPARWLPDVDDEAVARVNGRHIEIGGRRLVYGVDGLQKE